MGGCVVGGGDLDKEARVFEGEVAENGVFAKKRCFYTHF